MPRMKSGVAIIIVLFIFLAITANAQLSREDLDEIRELGEKGQELVEKYQNMELEKYNKVTATAKDAYGNPVSCELQIYYDDALVEHIPLQNGQFQGIFNHGKNAFPERIVSVAVTNCPCMLESVKIEGPKYPSVNEIIEKLIRLL